MVLSWAPGRSTWPDSPGRGSLGCGDAVDATLGELTFDGSDVEGMEALLAAGHDPNSEQEFYSRGVTSSPPLSAAAFNGNHAVIAVLCRGGTKTEWREPNQGDTALHTAAYYGHSRVCIELAQCDANLDALDHDGRTRKNKSNRHHDLHGILVRLLVVAAAQRGHDGLIKSCPDPTRARGKPDWPR